MLKDIPLRGLRMAEWKSRAIGTVLNPHGPVIVLIRKGEAYYGDTTILGKPYIAGYEPIRDSSGGVIGIYYVGYMKV
jgi:hypothetical protein